MKHVSISLVCAHAVTAEPPETFVSSLTHPDIGLTYALLCDRCQQDMRNQPGKGTVLLGRLAKTFEHEVSDAFWQREHTAN